MVVIFPLFLLSPLIPRGFWTGLGVMHLLWHHTLFCFTPRGFLWRVGISADPGKPPSCALGQDTPGAKTLRHKQQPGSCVGCSLLLITVSLVLQTPTGPASTWEPSSASNAQGSTATSARTCRGCAPWTWTIGPSSSSRSCQPLATSWPTVCGRRTAKATWSLPQTPPGGFWLAPPRPARDAAALTFCGKIILYILTACPGRACVSVGGGKSWVTSLLRALAKVSSAALQFSVQREMENSCLLLAPSKLSCHVLLCLGGPQSSCLLDYQFAINNLPSEFQGVCTWLSGLWFCSGVFQVLLTVDLITFFVCVI